MVSRVAADRNRSFVCEASGAILRGCPDHTFAWAFCLTIFTSSRRPPPFTCASRRRGKPSTMSRFRIRVPDQKRQGEAYCATRGYQLVETYVEPGASATNDRRPEFQRMIEAGTSKSAPFDIVIVHSFIAATISARLLSGSRSQTARSVSSARKAICFRR